MLFDRQRLLLGEYKDQENIQFEDGKVIEWRVKGNDFVANRIKCFFEY